MFLEEILATSELGMIREIESKVQVFNDYKKKD